MAGSHNIFRIMTEQPDTTDPLAQLGACRQELEHLDREIIALIGKRLTLARRTTALKRAAELPILDPQREAVVIRKAVSHARKLSVPEEPVREIFWHIVGMSRRIQEEAE
jgi:chorismate mutase